MLLGVRGELAAAHAAVGRRVRLYLPFGRDWWPYAIRRVGENPGSVTLLARSLASRG
jgi:proline dehydrogenase